MTLWSWISRRRQWEVIRFYIEHVNKIIEVMDHAKKTIEFFSHNDVENVEKEWNAVFKYEKEADDIKRRVLSELCKEIFHPIDREELVRLALTSDDVAAYAKDWTRRLTLMDPAGIPRGILSKLYKMADNAHQASILMRKAAEKLLTDPKEVLEIANEIERLEEETDDVRHDVFKDILQYCEESKISQCIMIKEVMDSIENSMNKCEDVADTMRSIALLSV
ncbi:MAG: DUF47 family protein [Zestosphaera sp.]